MSKERKKYYKKIFKILEIADSWTLDQVYRFCVNVTKPEEKGGEVK